MLIKTKNSHSPSSGLQKWENITGQELKGFLDVILNMGLHSSSELKDDFL